MATEEPKSAPKTFDVSKPGKTPADPNSRPTIVGNRTIIKDPTVVSSNNKDSNIDPTTNNDDKLSAVKTTVPDIEPIDPSLEKAKAEADKKAEKAEETKNEGTITVRDSIDDNKPEAPLPEDKPEDKKPEPKETEDDDDDSVKVDTVESKAENQKLAEKQAEEAAAKQEALEKLVAGGTYHVEINERKHSRRSRRNIMVWSVLAVVLILVLLDLLLDTGVIKSSIKPPLRLFKTS